ncbi:MAG: hypothetical protein RMK49_11950 [Abditibacteriales bacterium]|nr:hypothetical protein [Abditibacteriales bacterium]
MRWLGGVVLIAWMVGCGRPVPLARRPPKRPAQTKCYVDVAAVARRHPLWPAAHRAAMAPAPPARAPSLPAPLPAPAPAFPADAPEPAPPPRPSSADEQRRRALQQEAAAVREFETALQQMAAERAAAEIQRRLAQARAQEEANRVRWMENLSQQLREDLSRWREQELRQLAWETQPRRLRLALKTLPTETRRKLEEELKQLEADAAARLERKQQDVKNRMEAEERRWQESARQRLEDVEQSLRDAMPLGVSLSPSHERLARDFAPPAEPSERHTDVISPPPADAAVAGEPAGVEWRVAGRGRGFPGSGQRTTRNVEGATLRAYLLKDTAKRVRQLARERRWQLVAQRNAPGVVDKTQECIRLLRASAWQVMHHDSAHHTGATRLPSRSLPSPKGRGGATGAVRRGFLPLKSIPEISGVLNLLGVDLPLTPTGSGLRFRDRLS